MRESVMGQFEVLSLIKAAVAGPKESRKKGEGKAGASSRGKTSSSSAQDDY